MQNLTVHASLKVRLGALVGRQVAGRRVGRAAGPTGVEALPRMGALVGRQVAGRAICAQSFQATFSPFGTGGLEVIRKEAWPFYRTSSGVRLCWELEEPKGPKGQREPERGRKARRDAASLWGKCIFSPS